MIRRLLDWVLRRGRRGEDEIVVWYRTGACEPMRAASGRMVGYRGDGRALARTGPGILIEVREGVGGRWEFHRVLV